MPDWLARFDHAFSPLHLERLFLGHQKFCHFRTWYGNQLAAYIKEVLFDPRARARSYVDSAVLESLITSHIKGTVNATVELHKLLSLELLHRTLLAPSA